MRGKNILITGGSEGLGRSLTLQFANYGAKLVLVARNQQKLQEIAEKVGKENVVVVPYDLCDLKHIEDIFITCKNQGIKLDGMIHCAGINKGYPIKVNDVDVMEKTMKINAMSFVELGKQFCKKKYSNDKASIVAISSMASLRNVGGMCVYSSSKAALNSIVQVMARENQKRRIRVNAILPGYLEEQMRDEVMPIVSGDEENYMKEVQPFGRIGYKQIGYLTEFLMSDKAEYITGGLIPVSGGQ